MSVYPDYQEAAAFGQLFNRPTERLELKLNFRGEVLEIVNQNEVYANWQALKEIDSIAQAQSIIEAGNRAFSNTLPILKEQLLYQLIFTGLSVEILLSQWKPVKRELSNHFKGQWIPVDCKKNLLTNDEQGVTQINLLNKSIQTEEFNEDLRGYYHKYAPAFFNDSEYYKYISRTSYFFSGLNANASKIISDVCEELTSNEKFHVRYEVLCLNS